MGQLVESYPVGTIVDGRGDQDRAVRARSWSWAQHRGPGIISEMAMRHIDTPAQVVAAGDEIKVKVMEINPSVAASPLSMKAAAEELGFEIEVDESIQVEEKPARKKAGQAEGRKGRGGSPRLREAPAAEAAAEPAEEKAAENCRVTRRAGLSSQQRWPEGPAACGPFIGKSGMERGRRVALGMSGGVGQVVSPRRWRARLRSGGVNVRVPARRRCRRARRARRGGDARGLTRNTSTHGPPFEQQVIEPFVRGPRRGAHAQPPASGCNARREDARAPAGGGRPGMGFGGHGPLCRIARLDSGRFAVLCALDTRKDQFTCCRCCPKSSWRASCCRWGRDEGRGARHGRRPGLVVADKPESQDVNASSTATTGRSCSAASWTFPGDPSWTVRPCAWLVRGPERTYGGPAQGHRRFRPRSRITWWESATPTMRWSWDRRRGRIGGVVVDGMNWRRR